MDVDRASVVAMAEAARWAPSVHNTQPWRFRSRPDGLEVAVDSDRRLPALDPTGRLRTISCGAAVAGAATASIALGYGTMVRLLPDGPRGRVVARVVTVYPRTPTRADRRLADAVPRRRTHRALHPHEPVPTDMLDELVETVADEGARLTVLGTTERRVLAGLTAHALRQQHERAGLLAETQTWLRRHRHDRRDTRPVDGVLLGSLGTWPYPVGSAVREQGPVPRDLETLIDDDVLDTTVVVVSTPTDTRRDHLLAGIAMQRMLLHATALGLGAAFSDVATQVPATRADIGGLLGRRASAQVVLRLGRPLLDVRVPPRRPLAELLDGGPTGPVPRQAPGEETRTHERTPS